MSKKILKVFNTLIETVEGSSANNQAVITNVELWAESWRKEMEEAMNYIPCCESDSEQLKSVENLGYTAWKDKLGLIKDVDKSLYKLYGNYITVNEVLDMYEVYCDTF